MLLRTYGCGCGVNEGDGTQCKNSVQVITVPDPLCGGLSFTCVSVTDGYSGAGAVAHLSRADAADLFEMLGKALGKF
jgi:hypothetical protein